MDYLWRKYDILALRFALLDDASEWDYDEISRPMKLIPPEGRILTEDEAILIRDLEEVWNALHVLWFLYTNKILNSRVLLIDG